jgi:hypothetical protein
MRFFAVIVAAALVASAATFYMPVPEPQYPVEPESLRARA